MFHAQFRSRIAMVSTFLLLSAPGIATAAQRPAVEREAGTQATQQVVIAQDQDARETREKLEELLKKLPPAVGRVLRTDPSLMGNEAYLSTYPALAAFIKQHPEVRNTPGYFFEHVGPYEFWNPSSPPETREAQAVRIWRDMLEFFAISGVVLTITFALIWIVRTLVEYRRWLRTSKVHTEVHNKLLDRFTANEDLLAYIQTPAGRRFLESAPLSVDTPVRPVGSPFSRILWSVQVGVVLAAGALGLLFVSLRVIEEVAQPLFAIGVLALALGAGFVVSAAASFLLSRRLGLFEPVGAPREHSGSTAHRVIEKDVSFRRDCRDPLRSRTARGNQRDRCVFRDGRGCFPRVLRSDGAGAVGLPLQDDRRSSPSRRPPAGKLLPLPACPRRLGL